MPFPNVKAAKKKCRWRVRLSSSLFPLTDDHSHRCSRRVACVLLIKECVSTLRPTAASLYFLFCVLVCVSLCVAALSFCSAGGDSSSEGASLYNTKHTLWVLCTTLVLYNSTSVINKKKTKKPRFHFSNLLKHSRLSNPT